MRRVGSADDRGESLIELLVAVLIMGTAVVAVVGGLGTAIMMTDIHRKQAAVAAHLNDLRRQHRKRQSPLHRPRSTSIAPTTASYPDYTPGAPYNADVTQVRYWNGSAFAATCAGERHGVQRVTLRVWSTDGRVDQTMDLIIRKPCRPTEPPVQLMRDERGDAARGAGGDNDSGIIIMPLGDAMIGFIRNTDATTRRMIESHDIQIATAYFAQDIQNLGVRDWSSPTFALRSRSTTPAIRAPGWRHDRHQLAWDDPTSVSGPPTVVRVNYVVRDVGGEHQLRRLLCRGSATVESDLVSCINLVGTPRPPTCCESYERYRRQRAAAGDPHRDHQAPGQHQPTYPLTLTGQRRQT